MTIFFMMFKQLHRSQKTTLGQQCVRIYQEADEGSARIALRDVELPEKKNLVRIINSQNNERVFFAEKVVLVEGITDRLVFSSLVESCAALFNNN
jgi:predicted ATP-dependent endonuclease of OLD family